MSLFYGAMALVASVASWAIFREAPFCIRDDRAPMWISTVSGVSLGLAVVWATRWCSRHTEWAKRLDRHFRRLLGRVGRRDAAVMALCSGLAEEMLFRG